MKQLQDIAVNLFRPRYGSGIEKETVVHIKYFIFLKPNIRKKIKALTAIYSQSSMNDVLCNLRSTAAGHIFSLISIPVYDPWPTQVWSSSSDSKFEMELQLMTIYGLVPICQDNFHFIYHANLQSIMKEISYLLDWTTVSLSKNFECHYRIFESLSFQISLTEMSALCINTGKRD